MTLLYIDPVSKILALSELKHLTKPEVTSPDQLNVVSVGSIIRDAVIVHTDVRRGVHLRLPDKQKAYASVCYLNDSNKMHEILFSTCA